jgi:phage terminase large subunit-like protein
MTISIHSKPSEIRKWYAEWLKEQKKKKYILDESSPKVLTTWYANKVICGDIVASKKVILAAKRHLRDLERQGTEDFPFIFDEAKAHRPIQFIEKFCKPSKGDFNKIVVQPWQHFALGSLYGWVHKDTGFRRFREGIIFVARKNGKTTKISGLANFAVSKDFENGSRVYVLANTKQQAGELFDESRAMVQSSKSLQRILKENQKGIFHDKTKSRIESRASDSKKLDGLNTHLGIFDEVHEFNNYKLINVIKRSWSARKQPMLIYITTAGYELNGPLVDYYEMSDDVLNEVLDQDRKFYFMAELDDEKEIENPAMWIKANPNIGVTLDLPQLIEDFNTDRHIPEEYGDWVTKQFNLFADNDDLSYLSYEVLKRNNQRVEDKELIGRECIGGFDLSETEDFTSACLEFSLDDRNVAVISHSWIPRKKVEADNEKLPYEQYVKSGFLTICEGDYVNYEDVYQWFVDMSKKYKFNKITYDRANAFKLVQSLEEHGFEMIEVRQGHLTLSPPMKDLKEIFIDGKFIYNENPLLKWYLNNVKLVKDRNGNHMPTKQDRYRKIDGFAAVLNAHSEIMKMSTVEKKGNIGFISMKDIMS